MATNLWVSQSTSGYNSSPPPDDGTTTEANRTKYATIKTKLADPVKTRGDNIDTQLTTSFAGTINRGSNQDNLVSGSIGYTASELTIATSGADGVITSARRRHTVDTESDAASDNLDRIDPGTLSTGALIHLSANNAGRTVIIRHNTGTGDGKVLLFDNANYTMDDLDDNIMLELQADKTWVELWRSQVDLITLAVPTFTSSEQTVTADTQLDIAHSISAFPILVQVRLVCDADDAGYTDGDEIVWVGGRDSNTADTGAQVFVDATNVTIIQSSAIPVVGLSSKNAETVDVTKWRWVARAWK